MSLAAATRADVQDPDPRIDAFRGTVTSARSTVKDHRGDLRKFAQWCASRDLDLSACTSDDVAMYVRHMHATPLQSSTVDRHGWTLQKFYAWMLATGKVDVDPTVGVVSAKFQRGPRTDVLDVLDLRALIAAAHTPQETCVILLLTVMGLSNQDIAPLDVGHVAFTPAGMSLRPSRSRGGAFPTSRRGGAGSDAPGGGRVDRGDGMAAAEQAVEQVADVAMVEMAETVSTPCGHRPSG